MTCEPWPIEWPCDTATTAPELLPLAQSLAEQLLWAVSGRRIGACEYVESYWPPCTSECGVPYKGSDGEWRNRGSAAQDCCRILLAHRPVQSVEEVLVEGVTLDPAEYTTDGTWLRRRGECWPCGVVCDDPPVEVHYTAGVPFPEGTALAVGEVACEFLTALTGGSCRLPSRMTSITRQGVTVQLATADEFTTRNRLGLPIADAWLTYVNPGGLSRPSGVYSPDLAMRG